MSPILMKPTALPTVATDWWMLGRSVTAAHRRSVTMVTEKTGIYFEEYVKIKRATLETGEDIMNPPAFFY